MSFPPKRNFKNWGTVFRYGPCAYVRNMLLKRGHKIAAAQGAKQDYFNVTDG
jgi:hypothetical protein